MFLSQEIQSFHFPYLKYPRITEGRRDSQLVPNAPPTLSVFPNRSAVSSSRRFPFVYTNAKNMADRFCDRRGVILSLIFAGRIFGITR